MKVSVIVAAYNIEDYIERCLESLVNQTLKEIEIIIVNDGSIDHTPLKIKKFSDIDTRIRLINQDNQGTMAARNNGLSVAKGEYILFVDGDDWLEFNALEILYENAKKNNSDIVLYQAFSCHEIEKNLFLMYSQCRNYSLEEILLGKIMPSLCSKLIKLDYIKSNNIQMPINISFAEDLATCCSLFVFNPKISTVEIPLYNYYKRSNSITNQINAKVLELDDAFVFIKEVLYDNGLYSKYKNLFEYSLYHHMFNVWFLRYVGIEKEYNLKLYNKYKKYNININSNTYIREKISNYPLSLKIRIHAYHHSYRLGKLYDYSRSLIKRG